jgi:hypothetical protein
MVAPKLKETPFRVLCASAAKAKQKKKAFEC